MNESIFAKTLCSLRTEAGETQETVAAALGISPKTLSKWENGASEPELSLLCALADYYGVSADRLLGRNGCEMSKEKQLDTELEPLTRADAASHIFASNMTAMHRLAHHFMNHALNEPSPKTAVPPQMLGGAARSVISSDTVYALGVNREALNLYVMLCGNTENFAWLSDDAVICRMAELFAALSTPDAIALLRTLNETDFPCDFSAAFAAKKAGITEESAESLLKAFTSFGIFCSAEVAHLSDGDRTVYHCEGSGLLLTVLSLIYEQLYPINVNMYAYHSRCRLIAGKAEGGAEV